MIYLTTYPGLSLSIFDYVFFVYMPVFVPFCPSVFLYPPSPFYLSFLLSYLLICLYPQTLHTIIHSAIIQVRCHKFSSWIILYKDRYCIHRGSLFMFPYATTGLISVSGFFTHLLFCQNDSCPRIITAKILNSSFKVQCTPWLA